MENTTMGRTLGKGWYGDYLEFKDMPHEKMAENVLPAIEELMTALTAEAAAKGDVPDMTTLTVCVIDWKKDEQTVPCAVKLKEGTRYTVGVRFNRLEKED